MSLDVTPARLTITSYSKGAGAQIIDRVEIAPDGSAQENLER